jgi:biotin carboxyl carrier protein
VKYEVTLAGKTRIVELVRENGSWRILLDGDAQDASAAEVAPYTYSVLLNGESHQIRIAPHADGSLTLHSKLADYSAVVADPRSWRARRHGALEAEGRQQIAAPMPGKVVRLLIRQGEAVEAGQGLLVVEAMKMQNEIRSPKSGKVERLFVSEGQAVNAGEVLLWVE